MPGSPRRSAAERRDAAVARRARRADVEDPAVVMEAAAAFLAVRPRSREETRRRLRHLGYPAALTDRVVERLVEMRYLDDAEFARLWVASRDRARPRGAMVLRRELRLKGVDRDTIEAVLTERAAMAAAEAGEEDPPADADHAAAASLLERRAAGLRREADPRKRRQKAYALLARNGFAPDICAELAATIGDPGDAAVEDAV